MKMYKLFVFLISFSNSTVLFSQQQPKDSLVSFSVYAKDLSEDVSLMSSHNDELFLLVYEWKDTSEILSAPVLSEYFVLDTVVRSKKLSPVKLPYTKLILFLVELDEESRTIEQIDPVLRIHRNKIIRLFDQKKFTNLDTYLGDDDLLTYVLFDPMKENELEIKGRQSLDSYTYRILIK